MPLGLYISIPFCRSKCTFCNFASGVFPREKTKAFLERLRQEIAQSATFIPSLGGRFEKNVDSIYFGGGTPTTLPAAQLGEIFQILKGNFDVKPEAEITVECAPGTLRPEILDVLLRSGVKRVSLGAQSFVEAEIRSVGRLHTAGQTKSDVALLQANGINNLNLDLIAGLPYQTRETWRRSLEELAACGVLHASVYLLEVDLDSRLGRELVAGGTRYHAHHVPDVDLGADLYLDAVEFLNTAGLQQYEISNFARPGSESRHNLKYWTRQPYLGFGLDAHSMIPAQDPSPDFESVRFSNTDDLEAYLENRVPPAVTRVSQSQAEEELMFLGLRTNDGVEESSRCPDEIEELIGLGLLERNDERVRLTPRGRLLSNEVFERFISKPEANKKITTKTAQAQQESVLLTP